MQLKIQRNKIMRIKVVRFYNKNNVLMFPRVKVETETSIKTIQDDLNHKKDIKQIDKSRNFGSGTIGDIKKPWIFSYWFNFFKRSNSENIVKMVVDAKNSNLNSLSNSILNNMNNSISFLAKEAIEEVNNKLTNIENIAKNNINQQMQDIKKIHEEKYLNQLQNEINKNKKLTDVVNETQKKVVKIKYFSLSLVISIVRLLLKGLFKIYPIINRNKIGSAILTKCMTSVIPVVLNINLIKIGIGVYFSVWWLFKNAPFIKKLNFAKNFPNPITFLFKNVIYDFMVKPFILPISRIVGRFFGVGEAYINETIENKMYMYKTSLGEHKLITAKQNEAIQNVLNINIDATNKIEIIDHFLECGTSPTIMEKISAFFNGRFVTLEFDKVKAVIDNFDDDEPIWNDKKVPASLKDVSLPNYTADDKKIDFINEQVEKIINDNQQIIVESTSVGFSWWKISICLIITALFFYGFKNCSDDIKLYEIFKYPEIFKTGLISLKNKVFISNDISNIDINVENNINIMATLKEHILKKKLTSESFNDIKQLLQDNGLLKENIDFFVNVINVGYSSNKFLNTIEEILSSSDDSVVSKIVSFLDLKKDIN